jgi:Rrf2 family protein
MMTSKAKYALRAMIDLATQDTDGQHRPVFIADVAERQDIPRRFLETILLELRKHDLVVSHRGKAGGYALARNSASISFADVIRAIDGPLALTPCTSRTDYQSCEDCLDEALCAIRTTLGAVRDATADILEKRSLADAASDQGKAAVRPPAKKQRRQD